MRMNRSGDALQDLNRTIMLAPSFALGYRWRGHVHNDNNMKERAISDYMKALELGDNDVQGVLNDLRTK